MVKSPSKNLNGVVRYSIYSDDLILKNKFQLKSLYVHKEVNRIGSAILHFTAGDMAKNEVSESDDNCLSPGKKIRIEAGYEDDESSIFEGIVTSHSFVVEHGNEAYLEIECRDYAFPATFSRKNKVFEKKKDNEIIQEVLKTYSPLSVTVDSTKTKYNELVQYYCSDWDFALSRAEANGLVIVTEGKKISVKKPEVSVSPKLKVTYGFDLVEFKGELLVDDQVAETEAIAWDIASQKIIKVQGKKPSLNTQGTDKPEKLATSLGNDGKYLIQTQLCAEESALQAWADSQRLKAGLSRIQGYCKFYGNAKALDGELIELDGLGKRFNGNAYIGSVEHEIKDGDWITTVGLGLPITNITERPDVMAPSASGFLPGIQGLHIGKVKKLDADPTKQEKIQVEIPILNGSKNTVWARLSNFWGSNDYGAFFLPSIGDEVVLGFFNNDPCHAVVLGSLYSSKQKPPYQLSAENHKKAIVTKTKMKLEFDDENKVITIETPGKNVLKISDKDKGISLTDQNKNKIELNNNGITIESTKGITLKAKTDIKIEAGTALEAKAKTDFKMEGLNVEGKAKATLKMKGTASAEFSASGNTTVKGAIVMIN